MLSGLYISDYFKKENFGQEKTKKSLLQMRKTLPVPLLESHRVLCDGFEFGGG